MGAAHPLIRADQARHAFVRLLVQLRGVLGELADREGARVADALVRGVVRGTGADPVAVLDRAIDLAREPGPSPELAQRLLSLDRTLQASEDATRVSLFAAVDEVVRGTMRVVASEVRIRVRREIGAVLEEPGGLSCVESERRVDAALRALIRKQFARGLATALPAAEARTRAVVADRQAWLERARRDLGLPASAVNHAPPRFPAPEILFRCCEAPLLTDGWLALMSSRYTRACVAKGLRARVPAYLERVQHEVLCAMRSAAEAFYRDTVRGWEATARLERERANVAAGRPTTASAVESHLRLRELRAGLEAFRPTVGASRERSGAGPSPGGG